tara:strand:+ start:173 stop:1126 length:954 start_codon:yes stop_codon:yes gene_type:complete
MKSICLVLIAATVLISVPYMLSADAKEMKYVPFWWSTDPITGEEVYTDYFSESSSVQREHNAYLAQSALDQSASTINPSIMLEVERSNMVEVITYEYQWIKVRDSQQPQGPFANPDFVIREKVAVSTWVEIEAPVTDSEVTDDITEDVTAITPEIVPEITEDITEVVTQPGRVSTFDGKTHWDAEEAAFNGQDRMSSQEYKDMKKKHEAWRAYETASKLMPNLYPPYVHHEDKVVEIVEVESVLSTPLIVVPITEPTPEPTPVPEVLVEPIVPNTTSVVPQITEPIPQQRAANDQCGPNRVLEGNTCVDIVDPMRQN